MADIVLEVVKTVVEWSWNPVKRGLSYVFHYKRKIQILNLQVEKLEQLQNRYQVLVDAALLSGDAIKPDVEIWLTDAKNAITDGRAMKNEAEAGKPCICGCCPNLKWRYSLSKKAVEETTTVNTLQQDGKFETILLHVHRPIEIESTMSTGDFEAFGSTRPVVDKIMEALKDNQVSVIGVYGMGGVGKTTMVKHIAAQARKDELFEHVIMAVVSQQPNIKGIQGQLADLLSVRLEEESEIGRAGRLKERIMRGKGTLIILDDIWNEMELSKIGVPGHSELQGCSCKVLLTTRSSIVCRDMKAQIKIPLNLLSESDSWNFFAKKAGRSFESTKFYDVAKKVCGECGGLPLALGVLAKTLGDKEIEEWKAAAQRLEMSQTANPEEDEGAVSECIQLSYDFLKSYDAKSCFLLCCLFPEDYDIKIEDLMKYGFGKGLFRDANTIDEARGRAHSVAKYLIACSLLLDGEVEGCVRMHDVIRDKAMSIAASHDGHEVLVKAGCGLVNWPKTRQEGYSAISLMRNDIRRLPDELLCAHLQILLLQWNYNITEIPETFFQSLNAIRVLDLSRTCISLLPHSFSLLSDLHVLDLSGTLITLLPDSLSLLSNLHALYLDCLPVLDNPSILGGLTRLEILSMRLHGLRILPKEIGELINLRMLDLSDASVMEIPSKVISRLYRLEELYLKCSFWNWGSRVERSEETNVGFDELLGLLDLTIVQFNLSDAKCLHEVVGFSPKWEKFDICIATVRFDESHYSEEYFSQKCATTLILGAAISTLPDWFVNAVTEKAMKLKYHKCQGINNLLVEYEHGRLQELKYLVVAECQDNLKELMNAIHCAPNKPVFENLEELYLLCLEFLKELCVGELPPGSLCNLKVLHVDSCALSNTLLPANLLQRLQNLRTLFCGDTSVEYVFESKGLEPETIVLKDLEEIYLHRLPELASIWNGPAPNAVFQNLRSFKVGRCMQLKYLFKVDVARCFSQLEDLFVYKCFALVGVIEPSEGTNYKVVFPELKNLILSQLPELTSMDTECPMLENLYVSDFEVSSAFVSNFRSRNQVSFNDEEFYRNALST